MLGLTMAKLVVTPDIGSDSEGWAVPTNTHYTKTTPRDDMFRTMEKEEARGERLQEVLAMAGLGEAPHSPRAPEESRLENAGLLC